MRVTAINKYYPPHIGGVEFHMRDVAEGIVTCAGADSRVLVCNEGPERVEEDINDVHVIRLARAFEYSSTPIAWDMRGAIAEEASSVPPPDVFHLHFPYPWGELAYLQAHPDIPTVLTYHSDIVRQQTALKAYSPFLERLLDRVELIIAGSPNMIEHSPYLAPRAEKCRLMHYGIHTDRYSPTPHTIARAAALREEHHGRDVVLFVGRLVYYKGVDALLQAMTKVDADLVVVGRGPLEAEMRDLADSLGIADRVTFLPPMPDADIAEWYHAADVLALPSVERSEAFGLVQIEAHASGTPVVSTALTTGVPYANVDGVTGLTVPPRDPDALAAALNRILGDDELRVRLGAQARERATTEFTIPRMIDDVMACYREAIDLHASAGRPGDGR